MMVQCGGYGTVPMNDVWVTIDGTHWMYVQNIRTNAFSSVLCISFDTLFFSDILQLHWASTLVAQSNAFHCGV
jgi:hypothetical protein